MPNKDRTGPQGKGPRTGRQMGDCAKKDETAQETADEDFSFGRGRNRRPRANRGCGRRFGFGRRFRQNEE
ncbi:MAG: DUF5320 domain-containing protein [Candidatus Nanoarchaeia archaeon]